MAGKRQKMPKEEAHQIFRRAFKKGDIALTEGNPHSGWGKSMARQLYEQGYLKPTRGNESFEINSYGKYLKDRYNTIKRLLNQPLKTEFGYYQEHLQPFLDFVEGKVIPVDKQLVYPHPVYFTPRPFTYLDFWRIPDLGNLYLQTTAVIFKSDIRSLTIKGVQSLEPFKMPRENKAYWLKVVWGPNDEKINTYFTHYIDEGQIGNIDELKKIFEALP
ncbi:MAG TPA: hypothetical protein ACFCUD_06240 [Cyclobacteriaceae bacterium]